MHSGTSGNNGGLLTSLLALANDNSGAGGGDHIHPLSVDSGFAAILDSDHHIHGTAPVTNPVVRERIYDHILYVNVHSPASPPDLIRGQIVPFTRTHMPILARSAQ